MANGQAVARLAPGYWADCFAHVPLTVWAASEKTAQAHAAALIGKFCPAYSWTVLPA